MTYTQLNMVMVLLAYVGSAVGPWIALPMYLILAVSALTKYTSRWAYLVILAIGSFGIGVAAYMLEQKVIVAASVLLLLFKPIRADYQDTISNATE